MNSSLNLSLLSPLLLLFLGSILPTHSTDRWRKPCSGKTPFKPFNRMSSKPKKPSEFFMDLSGSSAKLEWNVNSVRNDYIKARFHGEEPTSEEIFDIPGSPSWNASSDSMNETMLTCYENLARMAVLTRLVREGEQRAMQYHNFAHRFIDIEDHPEAGLYRIMCILYIAMTDLDAPGMSPETEAEVRNIRLGEIPNNYIRHVVDNSVLLVLKDSARQLSSRFADLAKQRVSLPDKHNCAC